MSKSFSLHTLPAETGELTFRREVKTQLIKDSYTSAIDSTLTIFYVKLTEKLAARKKELEDKVAKEEGQKFKDSVTKIFEDRIAALSAEKEYAATLIAHKSVPIYFSDKELGDGSQQQHGLRGDNSIEVDSILMRVSNNTVYQLDVVGKVDSEPIQMLSNNGYGLSLCNLMDGNQRLYFTVGEQGYYFRYKDLSLRVPHLIMPPAMKYGMPCTILNLIRPFLSIKSA